MLECVVNISEGVRPDVVAAVARAAGSALLDVHRDAWHHRAVLTLAGPEVVEAAEAVAAAAVGSIDLVTHAGAHPRLGVVDVVPFVPIGSGRVAPAPDLGQALRARGVFARFAAERLGLPCFIYGPERSLPEVRRGAFTTLAPDFGPTEADPHAGAVCVGARAPLVAYNLWLADADLDLARRVARALRAPEVRALAMVVGDHVQVSCNLVAPWRVGPGAVFDEVAVLARVERAELVGLVPAEVLRNEPVSRWERLDLGEERTIEARLAAARQAR